MDSPEVMPGKKACCAPAAPEALRYDGPLQPAAEPTRHTTAGSTAGMVRLDGGRFLMGTDHPQGFADDGEGPVREVALRPFWIDTTSVTNAAFAQFVAATRYTTEAERFGWSFVFHLHLSPKYAEKLRRDAAVPGLQWWVAVPGARWDRPWGQRSSVKDLMDHPVVHVSWNDACAFAAWAGKRLPTEAEWEYASRGGREQTLYPWGDVLEPRGKHRCNIWQGKFPAHNTAADGYVGTCPATAFLPNSYGLHNTSGNVWEWTADWFSPTWHRDASPATRDNPLGPLPDRDRGEAFTRKVQKGGSYLCHHSYCNRYRLGARTGNTPDSATTNTGFRCARDV